MPEEDENLETEETNEPETQDSGDETQEEATPELGGDENADGGAPSDGNPEGENNENPDETEDEQSQKFKYLDLLKIRCFGYKDEQVQTKTEEQQEEHDEYIKNSWVELAKTIADNGWNEIDEQHLEKSLSDDVENSYQDIAYMKFNDVDTEIKYDVKFNNNKQLWDVSISESPDAEMDLAEKKDFFKSDEFKKQVLFIYEKLQDANETYTKFIDKHIENGDLLKVDVIKLAAIKWSLDNNEFIKNLTSGKFINL